MITLKSGLLGESPQKKGTIFIPSHQKYVSQQDFWLLAVSLITWLRSYLSWSSPVTCPFHPVLGMEGARCSHTWRMDIIDRTLGESVCISYLEFLFIETVSSATFVNLFQLFTSIWTHKYLCNALGMYLPRFFQLCSFRALSRGSCVPLTHPSACACAPSSFLFPGTVTCSHVTLCIFGCSPGTSHFSRKPRSLYRWWT